MNLMKNGILKYWWVVKILIGINIVYKAYVVFYNVPLLKFLMMWCGVLQVITGVLWYKIGKGE